MATTIVPSPGRARRPPPRLKIVVAAGAAAVLAAVLATVLLSGQPNTGSGSPGQRLPASARVGALLSLPAGQILARSLGAARGAGSTHLLVVDRSARGIVTFSSDAGPDRGQQTIVANGGHAWVVVLGSVTYARGDLKGLTGFFQFPPGAAQMLQGRWLAYTSTFPGYQEVTNGVTLASALSEISLTGPLTKLAPTIVNGQRVIGIRGVVSPTAGAPAGTRATVYVSLTGAPLPVRYESVTAAGSVRADFSAWSKPLAIRAPLGAVPLAGLLARTSNA